MSVRVHIPTPMRQHTQSQAVVEVNGATVQAALDDLGRKFEGITTRIFENGQIRSKVSRVNVDRPPQNVVVQRERGLHRRRVLLPHLGGPFDVGEQERHGPRWSIAHGGIIPQRSPSRS